MVSELTFYSNNLSSKPAEVYNLSVKIVEWKRTKSKQKEAGIGPFFKKTVGMAQLFSRAKFVPVLGEPNIMCQLEFGE